jgi:AraC-like DNA-binding protein
MATSSRSSTSGSDPATGGRFQPRSVTVLRGRPRWSQHAPHPAVAEHVSVYWTIELRGSAPGAIRTLPDACVDVTLDLRGRPRAYVGGPQKRARTWRTRAHVHLLGARLHPGAAPLLGIDARQLTEEWTDLARFVDPADVRRLTDAVARARGLDGRIGALDAFFVDKLLNRRIDRHLSRALQTLFQQGGGLSVAALATAVGVDARTLNRLFQRAVGLPPKRFARIVRFQSAMRRLDQADNWAALAADLGYFDQAHLIREMKELFGTTPTAALPLQTRTR